MRRAASILLLLVTLPSIGLLSGWLLLNAQTPRGRLIALIGLAIAVWPALLFPDRATEHARIAAGIAILGAIAAIFLTVPVISPVSESRVSHQFSEARRFPRFSPANVVPEIEHINLAFALAPYFDPLIGMEQGREVHAVTMDVYHEMRTDADFRQVGSGMWTSYRDVLGGSPRSGHYYLYTPEANAREARPALVFLHGAAGNFKAYTWLMSSLAVQYNAVVIAPSFGFGNWREAGGIEAIGGAIDHAATVLPIDQERVVLIGLSNGGLGVSLAANEAPSDYAGLVFLSPVFATEITESEDFHAAWQDRPILIITGEADKRIPLSYVAGQAAYMSNAGVDVTLTPYPGEDHFLVFRRRNEVLFDIAAWLDVVIGAN